jgi:hypothetical protein
MATKKRPALVHRGDAKYTWDDTIAAIGQDFSGGTKRIADETIAYTDVVRYAEPWEIGNPIYWDESAAKKAGYRGVVVPWSAIKQTFTFRGGWRPGHPQRFLTSDVNLMSNKPTELQEDGDPIPMPPVTQIVVTDVEIEFFEPVIVGDHLTAKGGKLTNVRPRKTRLGEGAFLNKQHEIYNQRGELVARINQGDYYYNPA